MIIEVGMALLKGDFVGVLKAIFTNALKAAGADPKKVDDFIARAGSAIDNIFKKPLRFIGTLLKAIGQGFKGFFKNFVNYLKSAMQEWLFGAIAGAGIKMPEKLDGKGIFSLALQILGITEDNIFNRIEKKIGADKADKVRTTWDAIKAVMKDGIEGLWKFAEEQLKNLHEMVIGKIIEWVQSTIIKKALARLAVFFIPFAGLIAAAKTLWDAIKFIKENIERFKKVAETIMQVIEPAARGDAGPAAAKVEETLARLLPLAIEFLAKLVGLGDLDNKIKKILEKVQAPVNKAIDWCIDKVLQD